LRQRYRRNFLGISFILFLLLAYPEQVYGYGSTIIVAKYGGDYTTIQGALDNASDTALNPVTIMITPGTYRESLNICNGRYISLVGVDKRTCIIRDDSGDYYKAPLNIAGNVKVSNLTVMATHDLGTPALKSYAIHHDFPGTGTSEINNCILISEQNSAIGIGLQDQQTLIINDCELYKQDTGDTYDMGALYIHNKQANGAINQKLIVKNSRIEADHGYACVIQDANNRKGGGLGDARDTTISLYNNVFWSKTLGDTGIISGDAPLGAGTWGYIQLTADSFGNNTPECNRVK